MELLGFRVALRYRDKVTFLFLREKRPCNGTKQCRHKADTVGDQQTGDARNSLAMQGKRNGRKGAGNAHRYGSTSPPKNSCDIGRDWNFWNQTGSKSIGCEGS